MQIAYAARGIAAYEVRLALNILRWFYEFGASRLAFREQPLPSKPVIPRLGAFPNFGRFLNEESRLISLYHADLGYNNMLD